MSYEDTPELSIVVPIHNESAHIETFLRSLSHQQGVRLELILSDGASDDDSLPQAEALSRELPYPVRVIRGARGRAGQLNRGAQRASAPTLLFLHIDSLFPESLALRSALDALAAATAGGAAGVARVAGRFALEFGFDGATPFPYRFYGLKATLDRPGCTHGDQGFLIPAAFFREIGPFDTALPLQEDTFLAERIRKEGRWLLLPARIRTSPRRFLSEGLLQRQTLNAMLSNLGALGHFDLIEDLKGCYRSQHAAQRLDLGPFFVRIRRWIEGLPAEERTRFWHATGSYIRSNAWQLAFLVDVALGGVEAGKGGKMLRIYDRFLGRILDNRLGDAVARGLVRVWFRMVAPPSPPCPSP